MDSFKFKKGDLLYYAFRNVKQNVIIRREAVLVDDFISSEDKYLYVVLDAPIEDSFGNKKTELKMSKDAINKHLFLTKEERDMAKFEEKPIIVNAEKEEIKEKFKEENFSKRIQLIKKLKTYGFVGFIHTTEVENFKKIVETGFLYPRKQLLKNHLNFIDRAEKDVLDKTEEFVKTCCRFYYYYKTPTNYRAEYKNPVILVFNEDIINFEKGVYFAPANACYNNWTIDINKALKFDWEGIFERCPYTQSKYYDWSQPSWKSAKTITSTRNAELLIKDKLPIKYIKKILVKDAKTFNFIKTFCDEEIIAKTKISEEEFKYD